MTMPRALSPRPFLSALVVAVVAAGLLAPAGATAKRVPNPAAAVSKQLAKESKTLGKAQTRRLKRRVTATAKAARAGNVCRAMKELGRFIDQTKRLSGPKFAVAADRLEARARTGQAKLLRRARGTRACGKVTLRLSKAVKPGRPAMEALADGRPRPVTAMKGERSQTDFVENELLVSVRSKAQLDGLLRRTNGKVVESVVFENARTPYASTHLVRIPTPTRSMKATRRELTADLRRIDPRTRGSLKFADGAGLRTLAVAASEAARGLHVGVNPVFEGAVSVQPTDLPAFPGQQFLDSRTADHEFDPHYKTHWNAFTENNFREGGSVLDYGVVSAWQDLEAGGLLVPNSVDVAVIDSGFITTPELPGSVYDTTKLGFEDGKENHGFFVSQIVAGRPDNGLGAAGVGGPVARVRGFFYNLDGISLSYRVRDAIKSGARIINISLGAAIPAAAHWAAVPLEDSTQEAAAQDRLVIVSAGNDGMDVDAEDCAFACWEEEWVTPCENDGVLCVGGLADVDLNAARHSDSNYGFENCGSYDCSVKLFAPYEVKVQATNLQDLRGGNGTSYSAPYVAGAAALMLAASPKLSAQQMREFLLKTAHTYDPLEEVLNPDSNHKLPRWIDVQAAVAAVMPATPPKVGIVPPGPGGQYSANVRRKLRAVAVIPDGFKGQAACCTYTWRSDLDGPLGTGQEIDATFDGGPGTRTITVTATRTSGQSTDATATLTFDGNPPVPVISEPAENAVFYRGIKTKFVGSWTDPDMHFAQGDCAALRWTVDRGSGTPTILTGCQPEITFGINGPKTVTLEATDSDGNKATVQRNINVTDPPKNAPPVVQIISPDDGQLLDPYQSHALDAEATDPDGGAMTYSWTWQDKSGGSETEISTLRQDTWEPTDDIPFNCGGREIVLRFKATDANGTTVDSTEHRIAYPPC